MGFVRRKRRLSFRALLSAVYQVARRYIGRLGGWLPLYDEGNVRVCAFKEDEYDEYYTDIKELPEHIQRELLREKEVMLWEEPVSGYVNGRHVEYDTVWLVLK